MLQGKVSLVPASFYTSLVMGVRPSRWMTGIDSGVARVSFWADTPPGT
jgi:hypothetical protein